MRKIKITFKKFLREKLCSDHVRGKKRKKNEEGKKEGERDREGERRGGKSLWLYQKQNNILNTLGRNLFSASTG